MLAQYFPSADHPDMPAETLINIPRRWEPPSCRVLAPGIMVATKAPAGTNFTYAAVPMEMPFLVARVVECSSPEMIAVIFWAPPVAPMTKIGGG